jgi:hypothetical protein
VWVLRTVLGRNGDSREVRPCVDADDFLARRLASAELHVDDVDLADDVAVRHEVLLVAHPTRAL